MNSDAEVRDLITGTKPIEDDDATIARALEDTSVPALLMSMVHMSGDESLLDGPLCPQGIFLNEVQGFLSEDDQRAVRERALEIVRAYRDRGSTLPPPPSPETIHRMMNVIVAGEVPAEYVPMMLEEMRLDGRDGRGLEWNRQVSDARREDFHVAVIGCGEAGLLAAIRLAEAGIPYTVFEKNAGIGGTWYENTYPGCRVDVGNHFYCYSFEPSHEWTEFFARQPELRAYFERVADRHAVRDRIRFETEVVAAAWDDDTAAWSLTVRAAGGQEEKVAANAVISAVGQLNRPKLPDIDGIDSFGGRSWHSACWPQDADLAGKRVAVVGTGASAFQIVPTVADTTERIHVFQRTASWMFSNPNYHAKVGPGKRWALEHLPYYGRWYRFLLFWPGCDGGLEAMRVDPDWPDQERSVSAANEMSRIAFTEYIKEQVGDDPELLAKVVPDYVCLGKRTLQDNGSWLAALRRDDVELVTEPIERITADGIECTDGTRIDVDVIVYATGFHANRFLWPMDIRGRDATRLAEVWGDDPFAYLGITVPKFPNFFCLYGPGTNLAHGGSLIFHSECQVRYVLGCLGALLEGDRKAIECREEVAAAYDERLRAELERMVWSHPSIASSWYRNREGRVTVLSPWRLVDYWSWTRQPNLDDFALT